MARCRPRGSSRAHLESAGPCSGSRGGLLVGLAWAALVLAAGYDSAPERIPCRGCAYQLFAAPGPCALASQIMNSQIPLPSADVLRKARVR